MRFDVVTLFPELFAPHLAHGITRRAFESAQVELKLWPLRDFADGGYRRVDDRPFGGGPGMVMLAEPLQRALDAVRGDRVDVPEVVHFTPTGRVLDQSLVLAMAGGPGAVLLCWKGRSTAGPRSWRCRGASRRCRPCCCRATTARLPPGGAAVRSRPPRVGAPT